MSGNRVEIVIASKDESGAGFASYDAKLKKMETDSDASLNRVKEKFHKSGEASGKGFGDGIDHETKHSRSKIAGIFSQMGEMAGKFTVSGIGAGLEGLGESMKKSPYVLAAGVGVAALLAPIIGAAITSGILLGLGGGVLALGIKAALDAPGVTASLDGFKAKLKDTVTSFGSAFEGPVKRAMATFSSGLDRLSPAFGRIGALAAPLIDKLAPALVSMAERAMPGIERGMAAAVPLFETLAERLPEIGDAASSFFSSIASGGPGANAFLGDFLHLSAGVISTWGLLLGLLAKVYEKLAQFRHWTAELTGLADETDKAATNTNKLAVANTGMAAAAQKAGAAIKALIDKMVDAGLAVLSGRAAYRAMEAAIDDVTAKVRANGKTLDEHTAKGRDNAASLDALARSAWDVAKSQNDAATGGVHFAASQQRGADAVFRAGRQMGMSARAAIDYATNVMRIPPSRETLIAARGAARSAAEVRALNAEINRLHDREVIVNYKTYRRDYGAESGSGGGLGHHGGYAHGGIVGAIGQAASGGIRGGGTLVGENGPEILNLAPGTRVTPAAQTRDAMGAGAGAPMVILKVESGGSKLDDLLAELIRKFVRVQGGNVQAALGVRGAA